MNVLDLFSGLEGWSNCWREAGHNIFRVEIDTRFPAEHRDILDFDPLIHLPALPDVILASPPCTGFSVMQIGRNWTKEHQPKTDTAHLGIKLLERTIWVIERCNPNLKLWVMENPRAKMRKLPQMQNFKRATVTYCQYGEKRMKPTDLWYGGGYSQNLKLKPPCKNGMNCHISAPRGSTTGTQGMDSAESAKIPALLALEIMRAVTGGIRIEEKFTLKAE